MDHKNIKLKLNKIFGEMTSCAAGLPGIEGLHGAVKKKKKKKDLVENKVVDKAKQVWRDHRGKVLAVGGMAAAVAGGALYKNRKTDDKKPSGVVNHIKQKQTDVKIQLKNLKIKQQNL